MIFKEDDSGAMRYLYLNEYPFMVGIKAPLPETLPFSLLVLGIILLLYISILRWPLASIFGRLCRRKRDEKPAPRLARWMASLMALVQVVFIVGLALMLSNIENLMFGVPMTMKILLALPLVSILFLAGTFLYMLSAWLKGFWGGCARIHYTMVFLAGLAFLFFLNYWNLLGWKF